MKSKQITSGPSIKVFSIAVLGLLTLGLSVRLTNAQELSWGKPSGQPGQDTKDWLATIKNPPVQGLSLTDTEPPCRKDPCTTATITCNNSPCGAGHACSLACTMFLSQASCDDLHVKTGDTSDKAWKPHGEMINMTNASAYCEYKHELNHLQSNACDPVCKSEFLAYGEQLQCLSDFATEACNLSSGSSDCYSLRFQTCAAGGAMMEQGLAWAGGGLGDSCNCTSTDEQACEDTSNRCLTDRGINPRYHTDEVKDFCESIECLYCKPKPAGCD